MISTHPGLLQALIANLSDPVPKLVYADFLDEQGEWSLAAAYRWCAENRKWPYRYQESWWGWLREYYRNQACGHPAVLPLSFNRAMDKSSWAADSFDKVLQKLAAALQEIHTP